MKHFFLRILFILFLGTSPLVASASAIIGSTEPTQWLNNAELLGINAEGVSTAVATTLSATKSTILDTIGNALISIAQEQAANAIVSWVNGGFEDTPLIIGDPEKFIKQKGLDAVKANLSFIPKDSLFGDSIFSALVGGSKDISIGSQLAALSKDTFTSAIQDEICSDESLNDLAEEDISTESNSSDEEAVADKKEQLFDYYCNGDPGKDKEIAARLNDYSNERPSMNSFLAVAGGRNEYTRTTKALEASKLYQGKKEDLATKDIFGGAGAVSQKICNEYLKDDAGKNTSTCLSETTITPGASVQDMLSKAASAGIDRLTSITGDGALSGLVTTLATSFLKKGFNSAVSSLTSSGSSGGANSSTVTSSKGPAAQDLTNDPDKKQNITTPMMKQLTSYEKSLDDLEVIDNDYLSDIASYEGRLYSIKSCYDSLVADYPTLANSSQVTSGYAFYDGRMQRVGTIKNPLIKEKKSVAAAKNLVTQTKSQLDESKSSQEMSSIFNAYQSEVEKQNLPATGDSIRRKGEYQKNKSESSRDDELKTQESNCTQLRNQQGTYGG